MSDSEKQHGDGDNGDNAFNKKTNNHMSTTFCAHRFESMNDFSKEFTCMRRAQLIALPVATTSP